MPDGDPSLPDGDPIDAEVVTANVDARFAGEVISYGIFKNRYKGRDKCNWPQDEELIGLKSLVIIDICVLEIILRCYSKRLTFAV